MLEPLEVVHVHPLPATIMARARRGCHWPARPSAPARINAPAWRWRGSKAPWPATTSGARRLISPPSAHSTVAPSSRSSSPPRWAWLPAPAIRRPEWRGAAAAAAPWSPAPPARPRDDASARRTAPRGYARPRARGRRGLDRKLASAVGVCCLIGPQTPVPSALALLTTRIPPSVASIWESIVELLLSALRLAAVAFDTSSEAGRLPRVVRARWRASPPRR